MCHISEDVICVGARTLHSNAISHRRAGSFSHLVEPFWLNYLPCGLKSVLLFVAVMISVGLISLCSSSDRFSCRRRLCRVAGPCWALGSCSSHHWTGRLVDGNAWRELLITSLTRQEDCKVCCSEKRLSWNSGSSQAWSKKCVVRLLKPLPHHLWGIHSQIRSLCSKQRLSPYPVPEKKG